jgi:DNA-binding phage protein
MLLTVKQWSDCRTPLERDQAVAEAMRLCETITDAAKQLGMSRRHLTRLLSGTRSPAEKRRLAATGSLRRPGETSSLIEPVETVDGRGTGETGSAYPSLTYGGNRPTFRAVSTVLMAADDEVVVTLKLPRRCAQWLDQKAVERKYSAGQSKAAKSPIVVELIEQAMRPVEPATVKPAKPKPEGKKR